MKKIICLLMIFVLTGCGAKYQINITDNKIEENINISIIPNSNSSEDLVEMEVNSLDFINYIDKMDIKVLENGSSAIYDKLVTSDNGVYNINLKHTYDKEDYANSRVINECFENHIVTFNGKKTYIHLSGQFYCYDNEDIEIVVNSKNKVESSNGKRSGNSYKWIINGENYNNVDIEIKISDKDKVRYYIYFTVVIIAFVSLVFFGAKFYNSYINRNSINDI